MSAIEKLLTFMFCVEVLLGTALVFTGNITGSILMFTLANTSLLLKEF